MADIIDRDHQILHGIIAKLGLAADAGADWDEVWSLFLELASYTEAHFENEEELMVNTHYPDMAAHKAEHDQVRQWIRDAEISIRAGEGPDVSEVVEFLDTWLEEHVEGTDRPLDQHLSRRAGIFVEIVPSSH